MPGRDRSHLQRFPSKDNVMSRREALIKPDTFEMRRAHLFRWRPRPHAQRTAPPRAVRRGPKFITLRLQSPTLADLKYASLGERGRSSRAPGLEHAATEVHLPDTAPESDIARAPGRGLGPLPTTMGRGPRPTGDHGVIVTVLPDDAQLFVSLVSITVFPLSAQANRK